MNFLPTYYTMSYRDSPEKSPRDAFEEGVAKAAAMENQEDGIDLPCKDRCYEAGIIAFLLGAVTLQEKEENE